MNDLNLLSCTEFSHIIGGVVGIKFAVMLGGKSAQKPELAYVIVCKHSLMKHTDLIEQKFVVETNVFLLRCFHFRVQSAV